MSDPSSMVLDTILDAVGNTPLVRLNRVGKEYPCEILVKCEFMNPGGSVKDRIALRMIREAEKRGEIKPGDILVEPTSGNTGIGLAMAGAVLGYKVVIVMPEKMSAEKQISMEALGAQIVRTPTAAAHDSPESNFGVAKRICDAIPNAHMLQQFENPDNPAAHVDTTAKELLMQSGGKIDYLVAGAGTGGTLAGLGKGLKPHIPGLKLIGADPEGSLIGGGEESKPYQVEGIGYDFIPDVLDMSLVDEWIKTHDCESFHLAGRLNREEGLMVGGSCGSAMEAAIEIAKRCKGGERIVVILADGQRNYMRKYLCCEWMQSMGWEPLPKVRFVDWEAIQASGG